MLRATANKKRGGISLCHIHAKFEAGHAAAYFFFFVGGMIRSSEKTTPLVIWAV
jgi:hypothetical protein